VLKRGGFFQNGRVEWSITFEASKVTKMIVSKEASPTQAMPHKHTELTGCNLLPRSPS
jgi:hypothetical protein